MLAPPPVPTFWLVLGPLIGRLALTKCTYFVKGRSRLDKTHVPNDSRFCGERFTATCAYCGQMGRFLVKFCVFGKCTICPRTSVKWG